MKRHAPRVKRTPGKRWSMEFRVTNEEANRGDLRKLLGRGAPKDLVAFLKYFHQAGPMGDHPPTHRLRKDWEPWLKEGTLVHVPKARWDPPGWCSTDNTANGGGIVFWKKRGRWFLPRVTVVDERGNWLRYSGCAGVFDNPGLNDPWFKEYFEPIRRRK